MKKFAIFLLIVLITSLSLTSCKKNEVSEDENKNVPIASLLEDAQKRESAKANEDITKADSSSSSELTGISLKTKTKKLVYNGTLLEFNATLNSDDKSSDIGIILAINGIVHMYKTSENDTSQYMHILKAEEYKDNPFKIIVNPTVGENGETLQLSTAIILNPSYIPKSSSTYGNSHKMIIGPKIPITFKSMASQTSFKASKSDYENPFSEYFENGVQSSINSIKGGPDSGLSVFDMNSLAPVSQIDISKDREITLDLFSYSKAGGKYNLFVFQDYKPLKLSDGSDYIEMQLSSDILCTRIKIDSSNLKDNGILCAFAFPTDNNAALIPLKTDPILLV